MRLLKAFGICGFVFLLGLPAFAETEMERKVEDIVARLEAKYQKTLPITAFSLKYHFLNRQYRSFNYWDYQEPNLYMSQRLVEVDLEKRHFYDNDILYFSGGRLLDRVQFQNDNQSFFYEKSATFLGKTVLRKDMDNIDRFLRHMMINIDFLAIRALLAEANLKENVTFEQDSESDTVKLIQRLSEEDFIEYEFKDEPLQLVSIKHSPLDGIFVYDDYQTSRGMTYARSVYQYYAGETKPTYIKFIDDFDIIEQVDPAKLKLPEGYGPERTSGGGIFVAKEIAKDLYLVTDSSARRNSLLKVSGDNIMVFGAGVNTTVAGNIIQLIGEQFPNKTISSVYVTHPHGHQIAGLKVFAEQGIEIIADEYTISGIKSYPRFADDIAKFQFRVIEHEQVIDGAHFYVLENMHSKRQSFVHFKDSEIIFQSHFLHIPFDNTISRIVPSYSRTFIDFVGRKRLKFKRIVSNYNNNNITVDVVNRTYETNI